MSEVKVNKISPRTACGTVTLGDSGDTFTVPSGVTITNNGTQTGFGRTGTVDWNTTKITADPANAVSGTGYFCDTSGGAFTVTLPTSPSAGDIVALSDYTRTFNSNNLTIGRNSKPIGGIAQDAKLNVNGQSATFVFVDDTEGWININETQTSVTGTLPFVTATGGTPCSGAICGDYKIHTFTGPGTLCVSNAGSPGGSTTIDYLVVAGGGSGAAKGPGDAGGGGGAGGFRASATTFCNSGPSAPLTPTSGPTAVSAITAAVQGYPITVGAGGVGESDPGGPNAPNCNGSPGANSIFSSITSTGGGRGGYSAPRCNGTGAPGGSGGGGGSGAPSPVAGGTGNTPPVSPSQGNNGGASTYPSSPNSQGGAGGGALAVGGSGSPTVGAGGAGGGFPSAFGTSGQVCGGAYYFSGGGAGGRGYTEPCGAGGLGGGGGSGVAGTVNTGGGGGGGVGDSAAGAGLTGGSGIVIIRYKFQ